MQQAKYWAKIIYIIMENTLEYIVKFEEKKFQDNMSSKIILKYQTNLNKSKLYILISTYVCVGDHFIFPKLSLHL